jgi:uncharacterized repeat protein (TIGR01451 family)
MRLTYFHRARTTALILHLFLWTPLTWAAPTVGSFSPTQGKPGTQVVINGSGFSTATEVKFDTTLADFNATSDNRMVATVPVDATTGQIRVTNPTGVGASGGSFLVTPRISDFLPSRGATNTVLTIDGFNFIGTTNVLFNTRTAAFAVTAATQIQAIVPTGATNGPVTVQTPAGAATSADNFIVTGPAPIIDDFTPGVGAPGVSVIIDGANFAAPVTVKFNGTTDPTAAATAPSQISAHVPASAVTGKISVTTAGGTATSSNNFVVTKAPVITDFFPGRGQTNATLVTIEGINFDLAPISGVGFNGKPVTGISTPSPNQIQVTVPATATTGRITVTNSLGVGTSSNDFVITRAPIIDWFDPIVGPPGTPVTITGINLSNGPTVLKFNGVNAAFTVTGQNGTQIHTTVPGGAVSGPITMTNAFGGFATTSNFFVTGSAPYVGDLDPDAGPRGATVVITGGNFVNPVTVNFNGAVAAATATALTQIQATVPPNATTGPLAVTTSSGTSTNNPVFYVPPRLVGFSPTNGIVGSSVVLTGANFTGATGLLFNTATANFTITASNTISAIVPTSATTGPLTLTTPGGGVISTNNFRVTPNILNFSPPLGPVGTLVTILGTSFLNVTNVSFNNVTAPNFTVISPEQMQATVPTAATTGSIRVSTPDGTAVSATNFVVTRSSDLAVAMAESASLLQPGQSLTYTLTITNKGPSIVTGVTLTDTLPPGVVFVSANASQGSHTFANGIVTCAIGVLTNNTGATAIITVIAPNEGVLTNSAAVTSVESDLNATDNTASAVTTVISDASRTLQISLISASHVIISWPVSAVPFALQFLNSLSASNVWLAVTNSPVIVTGRNTVTNDTSSGSRFYRLQQR